MIWDSELWKKDLWRLSVRIEGRMRQKRWTERTGFLIEREIFFGFYAIRKLLDAFKLSKKIVTSQVQVEAFPSTGDRSPTLRDWDKIDRFFDLRPEAAQPIALPLRILCNEVVHSYVFVPSVDDAGGGLVGLFLSSDRQRLDRLLYVPAQEIVDSFRAVARDDLAEMAMVWDPQLQDYRVFVGRSMEDEHDTSHLQPELPIAQVVRHLQRLHPVPATLADRKETSLMDGRL